MRTVIVTKDGVNHPCHSEEQLSLFIAAGYVRKPAKRKKEADARTSAAKLE